MIENPFSKHRRDQFFQMGWFVKIVRSLYHEVTQSKLQRGYAPVTLSTGPSFPPDLNSYIQLPAQCLLWISNRHLNLRGPQNNSFPVPLSPNMLFPSLPWFRNETNYCLENNNSFSVIFHIFHVLLDVIYIPFKYLSQILFFSTSTATILV